MVNESLTACERWCSPRRVRLSRGIPQLRIRKPAIARRHSYPSVAIMTDPRLTLRCAPGGDRLRRLLARIFLRGKACTCADSVCPARSITTRFCGEARAETAPERFACSVIGGTCVNGVSQDLASSSVHVVRRKLYKGDAVSEQTSRDEYQFLWPTRVKTEDKSTTSIQFLPESGFGASGGPSGCRSFSILGSNPGPRPRPAHRLVLSAFRGSAGDSRSLASYHASGDRHPAAAPTKR